MFFPSTNEMKTNLERKCAKLYRFKKNILIVHSCVFMAKQGWIFVFPSFLHAKQCRDRFVTIFGNAIFFFILYLHLYYSLLCKTIYTLWIKVSAKWQKYMYIYIASIALFSFSKNRFLNLVFVWCSPGSERMSMRPCGKKLWFHMTFTPTSQRSHDRSAQWRYV